MKFDDIDHLSNLADISGTENLKKDFGSAKYL